VRFLIIDDNAADRELVIWRLQKDFPDSSFIEVECNSDFERALAQDGFDLVLTDYQLHWTNGLQILKKCKEQFPDTPVIMFTGTGNEEVAVDGLRSGLANYVLKKNLERLPRAIHETLEKARLQKQYAETVEQLRASEERYRELFEQGQTGVFVTDAQGRLLTCNPAFARIFGFASTEETLSVTLDTLYPSAEQFKAFLEVLQREKRLASYEVEMRHRDGRSLYLIANIVTKFDEQGKLVEIKGYLFDNTERKRLTEQLQQAQKLESLGMLVSGIAHDFNNMLGGILGYANRGLTRIYAGHPLYDNLVHIQEIANRAARMTQQLLAFSRRQVIEPTDVNLNTVIENLLDFISKILADHIEIIFQPEEHLKTTRVDYAQIEQVLMNLCINARDAMPNGGKLIIKTANLYPDARMRHLYPQMSADAYVTFSVQDNGIGMDAHTRSQIFEPFFTTKPLGKGTGLGLSMVHGIIAQHNGFIDVQSVPGEGTTFTIYLPAVDDLPIPLPSLTRTSHPAQHGVETILVVEDDPDLRFLMEEALRDYGYTVITACDGTEGLQLFEQHADSIALVISDLVTPRMMGKEFYDKVQSIRDKTRFLFVSGYQANQISQNFVLDKGFAFLQKPFDLDELATKVHDLLE